MFQIIKSHFHELYIATIYACTTYILRRNLWLELTLLQQTHIGPWCFIGDFNAVLGSHEKRGNLPVKLSCDEFNPWTDNSQLTHLLTKGAMFTWSNGRHARAYTAMRLDRVVCNESWLDCWSSISCCTLPRSISDHHPILLKLSNAVCNHPSPFKIFKMWTQHEDCYRMISEIWKKPVSWCTQSVLV